MDAMNAIQQAEHQEDLVQETGTVLCAAVEIGVVGLATIMVDLSKQGYRPLKPELFSGRIAVLWDAFVELVDKVLLPLAELNVVHADIRAGYDETSNIVCWYDKKRNLARMKLIDYESLVLFEHWDPPADGRYIQVGREWNAIRFVWWQCILVAYTWHGHVSERALKAMKVEELQDQMMKGTHDLGWLTGFRQLAKQNISADTVRAFLNATTDVMKVAN